MARFRRLPEPGPFPEAGAFPEVGAFPDLDPVDALEPADLEPSDAPEAHLPARLTAPLRSLGPRLRWMLRAQPRPLAQSGPEARAPELQVPEPELPEH